MNYNELEKAIKEMLPHASLEKDNNGQIVIYTDLGEDDDGNLFPFVSDED